MSHLETLTDQRAAVLCSLLSAQVDMFLSVTCQKQIRLQLYVKPNIILNVLLKDCLNSQTSFLSPKVNLPFCSDVCLYIISEL